MKNKFLFDVSSTLIIRILSMLIAFTTTTLLARFLGPTGMGEMTLFITIAMIGMQFGNLGMHASNLFHSSKSNNNINWLFGNSIFFGSFASLVTILVLYSTNILFPKIFNLKIDLFYFSLLWIPFGLSYLLLQNILIGIHKIQINNIIEIMGKFFILIFVFIGIYTNQINSVVVSKIYVIVAVLSLTAIIIYAIFNLKANFKVSFKSFKMSFGYGFKSFLGSLFMFLIIKMDIIMIGSLLNIEDVGIYSIATYVITLVMVLPIIVNTILFPKIVNEKNYDIKWLLAKKVFMYEFIIILSGVIGLMLLSEFFIGTVFGIKYLDATAPLQILLIAAIIQTFNMFFGSFISTINIPRSGAIFAFLVLTINICLNYYFIPLYGFIGAAYATLISYSLYIPYHSYYIYRVVILKKYNIKW